MAGPQEFEAFGLDSSHFCIVVTKCGYRFPTQDRIAPRHIMLLTPGAGDMRVEKLKYRRRRKPMFPFDKEASFDPAAAPE
jgi:microcystin degradation protein MlrC